MKLDNLFEPTFDSMKRVRESMQRWNQKFHFIVVGAGGNGGYLIPNLVRRLGIEKTKHSITLIDADEVELKNLTRQNFVSQDIGKNKAEVMAGRYSRAFAHPVSYVPEFINDASDLTKLLKNDEVPVFIGAVDNNATREIIAKAYDNLSIAIYLDAGNEEYHGQVVLGVRHEHNATSTSRISTLEEIEREGIKGLGEDVTFGTPAIHQEFISVLSGEEKHPGEMSCAENAVSNPQNIATNMTAANLMMNYLNMIISGEEIHTYSVSFNTKLNNFTTKLNKLSEVIPVFKSFHEELPQTLINAKELRAAREREKKEQLEKLKL